MPPPLVGEALADRRVFEGVRFAPICSADILSCLAAVSGFGASATRWKSESYAKGSPTRGAVAAKPATERLCKSKASPSPSFSPTFCYTDICQKEGATHQNCDLPRCPAADEFCAHAAVPAGGGAAGRGGVPGRAAAVGRGSGGGFLVGPAGPGSAGRCRTLI